MISTFLSIMLSICTFFMSMSLPVNRATAPADTSDFTPVLRFVVMSDTHIETLGDVRANRIQKALSMAYSDADADASYKNINAVMFCGDTTDNGTRWQYMSFASAVKSSLRDGTDFLAVIAKSHDCSGKMGRNAVEYIRGLTGAGGDWHVVINGYHFIGVSASSDDSVQYSAAQHDWVEAQLAEAAADDPSKPIFFTHHEHVSDTVYGSAQGEWGIDFFRDIFVKYPQLVHFSGHSHYPVNDPRSIWQDEFTAVGTGAITYMEFTVDGESRIHPDNYKKTGQFWIAEVDAANRVRLRAFDVISGELLSEYILDNLTDVNARQFTAEQVKASSSAPEFAENANLTVKSCLGKKKVTAPAAVSTDGKPVFLYRITVTDGSGNVKSTDYIVNTYWLGTQTYSSVTFSVSASAGDTVTVTAENSFGMASAPLTAVVG